MGEMRGGQAAAPEAGMHPDYLSPGTEINGFRLVRHVNSGGYGSVWLVESVHAPGKYYALKFSFHRPGERRGADERAEREVRLLLQVLHPRVLRVIAHGRWKDPHSGWRYMVMEWVEGATLLKWTRQHNPPLLKLTRVIQTLGLALQAAHEAGVLHRDVKPSNILVREVDGEPFLADFGAGDAEGALTLTLPGLPPGTTAYRSPEAWAFARHAQTKPYAAQRADDWYAVGVTLYVVLTEVLPFPETGAGFEHWVTQRRPVPPHLLNPRVPLALSRVVMRLLAKRPRQRYPDGRALSRALERALESHGDWAASVYPPQAPMPPREEVRQPLAQGADPAGEAGPEPLPRLFPEEDPAEQRRDAIARRRDELLSAQPRIWPVSWRWVGLTAVLLTLAAVAWTVWLRAAARPVSTQPLTAPATAPPLPAIDLPDSSPLLCPSAASSPWNQPPVGSNSLPPPLASMDTAFWKEDSLVNTTALRNTLLALGATLTTACPGVPVRPETYQCPPDAVAAMDKLGLDIGDFYAVSVEAEEGDSDDPVELRTGQWVSLIRDAGANIVPYEVPPGTRLFGEVLPSPGDTANIHYTQLQVPPGERIPICAIAVRVWKEPGSPERFKVQSNEGYVRFVLKFPQ
jgi:serine/threonine protein kinase